MVAEGFITTLKNKIYKYMASLSIIVYIAKLTELVRGYSDTIHRPIKKKPPDVKRNTCIIF